MTDSRCLYEVLGVERTASQADIKKVYHRLCLKLHPDKNPGDEEAKAKFQSLQRVYAILGDPQRRAVYDQTGITDEDLLGGDSSEELKAYFKAMFKEVTEDDLDDFYDKYRGSEEERADLLKYYREFKGDMAQVFEWLMCSQPDQDSHRFMATLQQAIDAGEVKAFKAFTRWSKQVASQPAPADPLKKRATGKDRASAAQSHALVALKQKREAEGQAFLAHLEHKYGAAAAGGGKKKKGRQASEPSEEEFEAARQRLMARAAGDDNKAGAKKKQAAGGQKKGKAKQRPASSDEDKENESDEEDKEEEEAERSQSASSSESDEAEEEEEEEEEEQPVRKKAKGGGYSTGERDAKAAATTKGKAGKPPTRGVDKKKAPRRTV